MWCVQRMVEDVGEELEVKGKRQQQCVCALVWTACSFHEAQPPGAIRMPKSLEFAIASASVLMPLIMRYAIARSFRLRRARVLGQRRCELFTAYRI